MRKKLFIETFTFTHIFTICGAHCLFMWIQIAFWYHSIQCEELPLVFFCKASLITDFLHLLFRDCFLVSVCCYSVVSDSLRPHELQEAGLPCPSLSSRVSSNLCPSSVIPSNHLILCCSLLLLHPVFPSILGPGSGTDELVHQLEFLILKQ